MFAARERKRGEERRGEQGAGSFSSARVEDEGKRSDVEEGNEGGKKEREGEKRRRK